MRITVNTSTCVGAAQCVLAAPDVFDQGEEDGLVKLLVDQPDGDAAAAAREAFQVCPSSSITIVED